METDQEEAKQEDGVEIGPNFFFFLIFSSFVCEEVGKKKIFYQNKNLWARSQMLI